MDIRNAVPADAKDILALVREGISENRSLETVGRDIDTKLCRVLAEGCKTLGFYTVELMPPEAELHDICVKRSERGRGYGDALLKDALSMAKSAGAEVMFLEVKSTNTPAAGLYEKTGFTREGVRKAYYDDRSDAIVMRLEII